MNDTNGGANNVSAAVSTLFLGKNGDFWDFWLIIAGILVVLAATAVGLTTTGSLIAHKREAAAADAALSQYKLTVQGKVSEARTAGLEAGKTASDALVRAAQLEKEAETAKLETERIKQIVAWRVIPEAIAHALMKALEAHPGQVNLRYTDGDPEALYLAIQISNILSAAKWQVARGADKPSGGILFSVAIPDGEGADSLRKAFVAAGLSFGTSLPQPGGSSVSFNVQTIPGAPYLIIGSRTPPDFK